MPVLAVLDDTRCTVTRGHLLEWRVEGTGKQLVRWRTPLFFQGRARGAQGPAMLEGAFVAPEGCEVR